MKDTMANYQQDPAVANSWDLVQEVFHCCGIREYYDWASVFDNNTVPDSCCMEVEEGCGHFGVNPSNIIKEGCLVKFSDFFENKIEIVAGKYSNDSFK